MGKLRGRKQSIGVMELYQILINILNSLNKLFPE